MIIFRNLSHTSRPQNDSAKLLLIPVPLFDIVYRCSRRGSGDEIYTRSENAAVPEHCLRWYLIFFVLPLTAAVNLKVPVYKDAEDF